MDFTIFKELFSKLPQPIPSVIFLSILILGILAITIKMLGVNKTKLLLLSLMLQAKRYAKDKILLTGKEQEDWVVKNYSIHLSKRYAIIIDVVAKMYGMSSEEFIRSLVRQLFYKLKDFADDGLLNDSYIDR